MPTKEQIESIVSRIEWLESMSYFREEGHIPEPASDTSLPWWEDLDRAEQRAVLDAEVDWGGFSEAERLDVERRVLDGEDAESWMDGIAAGPTEESGSRAVRPLTRQLIECREFDVWPSDEIPTTEETGSLLREKADDTAQRPLHEKGVRYEDEYHRQLDEYASRPGGKGQDKEIER